MIVRSLEDVRGTKGDAHGNKWHSMHLLHAEDGMAVTLTDSILEACYCLEGRGTVEELDSGKLHDIRSGSLHAMNNHERHRIRITERMRLVCTFVPALSGQETYDKDGSLSLEMPPN